MILKSFNTKIETAFIFFFMNRLMFPFKEIKQVNYDKWL